MRRARLPARHPAGLAASSWRIGGRCSWMRLATFHSTCSRSCCACCRSASSSASAARRRGTPTCVSSRRPIAIWIAWSKTSSFRSDLYYRLSVFPIQIPALRERAQDIPLLARYFADRFARRMRRPVPRIPQDVLDAFAQWRWPGNVRELENVIERAVILSPGPELQVPLRDFLPKEQRPARKSPTLQDVERENILRALRAARGVVGGPSGAAARLGLKRTTLQSLMRRLGIQRPDY